jgi:hypothetical protein
MPPARCCVRQAWSLSVLREFFPQINLLGTHRGTAGFGIESRKTDRLQACLTSLWGPWFDGFEHPCLSCILESRDSVLECSAHQPSFCWVTDGRGVGDSVRLHVIANLSKAVLLRTALRKRCRVRSPSRGRLTISGNHTSHGLLTEESLPALHIQERAMKRATNTESGQLRECGFDGVEVRKIFRGGGLLGVLDDAGLINNKGGAR